MAPYQIDNLIEILFWTLGVVSVSGGLSLILATWFRGRRRVGAAELGELRDSLRQIQASLDDLHAEQTELRGDVLGRVEELSGRVEFAERLLAKGDR